MSGSSHCPTCRAFLRAGHHICPPVRAVRLPGGPDTVNIYAATPADAAAVFFETDDLVRRHWPAGTRKVIVTEGKKKLTFQVTNTGGLTYRAVPG